MKYSQTQSGFTAVELLITLFVAVAFLVAGYQLYNFIIQQSSEVRNEAKISNIAYDYLRQYQSRVTNPCTSSTPLPTTAITVQGLVNVQARVTITCPNGVVSRLSRVEARITYGGSPQKELTFATYVNGASQ